MEIVFAADKGGVGKSVLAYHVATRAKQLGYDVGLVDLDRRQCSSGWANAADPPYFAAYGIAAAAEVPDHDLRVWDTPAHPSADMRSSLAKAADLVLVVTVVDPWSQRAAADAYRAFESAGARCRVAINQVYPGANEGQLAREVMEESGLRCLETVVRSYRCYPHAQWDGRAVCDYAYSSADKAWADIAGLTGEILALVGARHGRQAA